MELALVEELEATLPGAVVAAALHRPPADPEFLGALIRAVNEPSRNFTVSACEIGALLRKGHHK